MWLADFCSWLTYWWLIFDLSSLFTKFGWLIFVVGWFLDWPIFEFGLSVAAFCGWLIFELDLCWLISIG